MKKRKALVLEVTLGVIAILSVIGGVTSYLINRETKGTKETKDAVIALKAAESGAETGLAWLKSGGNVFPTIINGTLGNADFMVTIVKNVNNTIELTSVGNLKTVSRKIIVLIKRESTFYPFAINGDLTINTFKDTGSGSWSDAVVGVKAIDPSTESALTSSGFQIIKSNILDLPKVSSINASSFYPPESICDYGNYETDETISFKDLADVNGDGKIVICGSNVTLDRSLINFSLDTTIAAKQNVTFTRNTTLKKDVGSASNLSIIAGNTAYFDRNSVIDFSGADDGYNILIYAGQEIESPDTTGQWISISGNQNTSNVSNVFLLTPGEINVNRDLIDDTATTRNDVNFVIWADKGITSTNGGFDISGSSATVRNFSVIVADGNATFDKWQFTGSEDRSGLSYSDIESYCTNGTSLGIPDFYKNIYCELKNQIDSESGNFKIISWKVY
ncbi:hypothetical protein [Desulfurobacterium sp.]